MEQSNKYWFSIFIQDCESKDEIDALREKYAEDASFNICEYLVDMYCGNGFEDNEDNYTDYEPYIANNGSDYVVATYEEFTLLCNLTICGDYMLYRKARKDEQDWLAEVL